MCVKSKDVLFLVFAKKRHCLSDFYRLAYWCKRVVSAKEDFIMPVFLYYFFCKLENNVFIGKRCFHKGKILTTTNKVALMCLKSVIMARVESIN